MWLLISTWLAVITVRLKLFSRGLLLLLMVIPASSVCVTIVTRRRGLGVSPSPAPAVWSGHTVMVHAARLHLRRRDTALGSVIGHTPSPHRVDAHHFPGVQRVVVVATVRLVLRVVPTRRRSILCTVIPGPSCGRRGLRIRGISAKLLRRLAVTVLLLHLRSTEIETLVRHRRCGGWYPLQLVVGLLLLLLLLLV